MSSPLPQRYGKKAPAGARRPAAVGRRTVWILGVLLALFVAGVGWYAFAPSSTPTSPQTVSYDVVDSTLTTTTISYIRDPERLVVCGVQATNDMDGVVGYTTVTIPPDPVNTTSYVTEVVDVRTTQLASSGHVDSCWYA